MIYLVCIYILICIYIYINNWDLKAMPTFQSQRVYVLRKLHALRALLCWFIGKSQSAE